MKLTIDLQLHFLHLKMGPESEEGRDPSGQEAVWPTVSYPYSEELGVVGDF